MRRHHFQAGPSARREADLFLADLLGPVPARRPPGATSQLDLGADRFLAELMGESADGASAEPPPLAEAEKNKWGVGPWSWTPAFLRWLPANRGNFPARPAGAPGGSAFIRSIYGKGRPADWQARERAIFKQIVSGNVPDALARRLVRIELSVQRKGRTITGSVQVMPDYLCIGSDEEYVYIPMDPVTAQRVAFELDMNLPTARICNAVYDAAGKIDAKNQLDAIPRDYAQQDLSLRKTPKDVNQVSTAAYEEHSEAIQARMRSRGLRLGDLVAGHKKDVVLSQGLHANPEQIAFHGFYTKAGRTDPGKPIEPCSYPGQSVPSCKEVPSLAHGKEKGRRFCDYSQGVRLVSDDMIVDGQRMSMRKVLVDPELSWLISAQGPIDPPHVPRPPASILKKEDWEAAEEEAPPTIVRVPAATGLGTSATPCPIATISPQRQMVELLDGELILVAKARVLAEWIDKKLRSSVSEVLADAALVKRLDLSKDAAFMKRLRPWPGGKVPDRRGQLFPADSFLEERLQAPATASDVEAILRLMHFYGLVLLPGIAATPSRISDIVASITRVEARMERDRFDRTTPRLEAFATTFKRKIADGLLADAVVERETMPEEWNPAMKADVRRLAKPVVEVLRRLRARNTAWKVGLYGGPTHPHFWNEFSGDVFLSTPWDARQFYVPSAVRTFFDDLDTACRETAAPGPFAWKAIYNDDPLRAELDRKFGQGRVLRAEGHGPGPRIHIHLDLRPLSVALDRQTGFRVERGRVILL